MTGQILTAELVRNADVFIGSITLVFVLFDSLSKKADVPALKKDLDLRQSQLISEVVADLETAITPLLQGREEYTFDDDLISRPAPTLDDSARNALTAVIRSNEGRLAQVRLVKHLPGAIHSLNSAVFWLIAIAALVAFSSVGILLTFPVDMEILWLLLGVPTAAVLSAAIVAVIRHSKVQNAEKQILNIDSQA